MPNPGKIKEIKLFAILGDWLHEPSLWHLNRKSAAKAFLVGLFVCMLPLPGQMLIAAILAIKINANLPISVALVWITNPLTIPAIFYFNYIIGGWLLESPTSQESFQFNLEWITAAIDQIWWPIFVGSLVNGLILSLFGYAFISGFWHWKVKVKWRHRKQSRQKKD